MPKNIDLNVKIPLNLLKELEIYANLEEYSLDDYVVSALISAVFKSKQNAKNPEFKKQSKNLSDFLIRR